MLESMLMRHALATGVLALHVAFVVFVVIGQALVVAGWIRGWQWTRNPLFRMVHLLAMAFVAGEAWLGLPCPLTLLENSLREVAGGMYENGFIQHWLHYALYYTAPAWVFTALYSLFLLLIGITFVYYPPQWKR